jgi:hypothetical protein
MAHLPLYQMLAEGHRLQHKLHQTDRRCQGVTNHIRFLLSNHALHIGYVDLCMHDFTR